jgi:hypothetical protein
MMCNKFSGLLAAGLLCFVISNFAQAQSARLEKTNADDAFSWLNAKGDTMFTYGWSLRSFPRFVVATKANVAKSKNPLAPTVGKCRWSATDSSSWLRRLIYRPATLDFLDSAQSHKYFTTIKEHMMQVCLGVDKIQQYDTVQNVTPEILAQLVAADKIEDPTDYIRAIQEICKRNNTLYCPIAITVDKYFELRYDK